MMPKKHAAVKKVLIAGGMCGTTMLIVSNKITERCKQRSVIVETTIQNLLETSYVRPGYDLIVEMFPYFDQQPCPVLSGKPFINHVGEDALLTQICDSLCMEAEK